MITDPKDLPQMWQKPSPEELKECLKQLELKPSIWNHKRRRSEVVHEQEETTAYIRRETSTYLSSIIRSGLAWIEDDDDKELIWSEASRRMAERCGRTGLSRINLPCFSLLLGRPVS